ncbi:uncharacterized protein LOC144111117 isoform X2 [Amblyomma americanum]
MVLSFARTLINTARNVTSPLTSNVANTVFRAPAAVLDTAKTLTAPVTGTIASIPATVANAPKVVLNVAKNTTKVIAKGVSGTASALNPFSFFGKLTRAATIGIAVGVGLAVFIFLMCCLVSLWQCRRRRKEEERLVYYSPPPKAGFGFPPYDKTYQGSPQ